MKRSIIFSIFVILVSCGGESSINIVDGISDSEHRIFVTSESYNGNLGAIAGANTKCAALASSAGLKRTYKALISDSSSDAVSSIVLKGSIYIFDDLDEKRLVAISPSSLWSTSSTDLLNTITYDEKGQYLAKNVWSGSFDGGNSSFDHCLNWTSSNGSNNGTIGDNSQSDARWINSASFACNATYGIYCISL
ncbi:MAG: DUF1554 domain-containing protein [Bacteriovoracaceae bacterium]|jgi:hypothetical protein|nr:DUF1554 domain-containing protein [Bacteriovoracaceae bacterium]